MLFHDGVASVLVASGRLPVAAGGASALQVPKLSCDVLLNFREHQPGAEIPG